MKFVGYAGSPCVTIYIVVKLQISVTYVPWLFVQVAMAITCQSIRAPAVEFSIVMIVLEIEGFYVVTWTYVTYVESYLAGMTIVLNSRLTMTEFIVPNAMTSITAVMRVMEVRAMQMMQVKEIVLARAMPNSSSQSIGSPFPTML